jgi:hypothetical protein
MQVGEDDAMNTTDVATKTAKVVAVGPTNEWQDVGYYRFCNNI